MYTYIETIVDSTSERNIVRYSNSNEKINDLLRPKQRVYFLLSHTATPEQTYLLGLDSVQLNTVYDPDITIAQFLIKNGNDTLPTIDNFFTTGSGEVKTKDIYQAGYKVNYANRLSGISMELPDAYLQDISFVKSGISDYSILGDYCLLSVNGFLHRVESSTEAAFGVSAGRSVQVANDHQISIISFKDVGKIKTIPIVSSMVFSDTGNRGLYYKTYIRVNEDLSQKTILLSIGGYLQILDGSYALSSESDIILYPHRLSLEQRFEQSRTKIDLKEAGALYFDKALNEQAFSVNNLFSDEIIKSYLTLDQSFIIVLDVPYVKIAYWKAEYTRLAGRYYCYQPPEGLLLGDYGTIVPYLSIEEEGKYVIYVQTSLKDEYRFSDMGYKQEISADYARETERPVKEVAPLFMRIFK